MSQSFYTNVQTYGKSILYRGVESGRKIKTKIDYQPTLFVPSNKPSEYRTVTGEFVSPVNPGSIRDCRDFIEKYQDVENFRIYGSQRYEYAYIYENFSKEINWDRSLVNVCNIDIEVGSENGFPEPSTASEPITAITYKMNNKFIVYGCGDFLNERTDVKYIKCFDEIDLIKRFIDDWSADYPDIITGWNVKFFDIPYIVNRINNLLGETWSKRLSPWNLLSERRIKIMGRDQVAYTPLGIAVLDYIELYKKFVPGGQSQESYKLDAICHNDLGERKLSYDGFESRLDKLISSKSKDVVVPENKPISQMHDIEKWVLLKNKLKK